MTRLKLLLVPLVTLLATQNVVAQRIAPWRVYRMADGLAEPGCASVTIGSRGKIIVGHTTQPFAAEIDGFDVRRISAPAKLPLRYYQSPGGQLWTVTTLGLHEHRNGNWVLHAVPQIAEAFRTKEPSNNLVRLWPVRQGLVVFLLPKGLYEFSSDVTETPQVQLLVEASSSPLHQFLGMCSAKNGGIWVSGEGGLLRLMPLSRGSTSPPEWQVFVPPGGKINTLIEPREDSSGAVTCVAQNTETRTKCIARFNGQVWEFVEDVPESIQVAWRAGDQSCWAMSSTTLYKWQQGQPIAQYDELAVRKLNDVVIEGRGNFWLATSDGLYRYSPAVWRRPEQAADVETPITGMAAGTANAIWFMTGNSWFWLGDDKLVEVPLPPRGARMGGITEAVFVEANSSLAFVLDGALFQIPLTGAGPGKPRMQSPAGAFRTVGTGQDGLYIIPDQQDGPGVNIERFDGSSVHPLVQVPPGLKIGDQVLRCFVARNGNIWISGNEGLAVLRDRKWEAFSSTESLNPDSAVSFAEVGENRIWCSTPDRLWEYDGQSWTVLREGIDRVNTLLWTRSGAGWIGSNNGILRQLKIAWLELGLEDGLPSLSVPRLLEDTSGRIWAGTSHGLSIFVPEADPDPPRTRIAAPPLPEREIPENGAITISFEGTDKWKFTSRHRLLFSHRLDERDWSEFSDVTRVSFGDLSPGNHYFQVKSMDRNGNIDPGKFPMVEFSVVLPWYKEKRLMAIAASGVAIALFFAVLAVNRHWRLLRSYAEVEKKVAERTRQLESANHELLQSQKMTALGTLAAGIAHDFNNILSIIKGSAQIIEDNLDNTQKVQTRVDRIKTVVDQGAGIVKAMLGFSRDSGLQVTDVNEIVTDTVRLLGDRFLREVQVTVQTEPNLPAIQVSKDFVQQILINFIFNAAEAMTARSEVIVQTGAMATIPDQLVLSPVPADEYVRISVIDFGSGISDENLPRIFEPFFTTKAFSSRRGTGLGLSMVYRLATRMEAGLAVESSLNRGSKFTLILPVRNHSSPDARQN